MEYPTACQVLGTKLWRSNGEACSGTVEEPAGDRGLISTERKVIRRRRETHWSYSPACIILCWPQPKLDSRFLRVKSPLAPFVALYYSVSRCKGSRAFLVTVWIDSWVISISHIVYSQCISRVLDPVNNQRRVCQEPFEAHRVLSEKLTEELVNSSHLISAFYSKLARSPSKSENYLLLSC